MIVPLISYPAKALKKSPMVISAFVVIVPTNTPSIPLMVTIESPKPTSPKRVVVSAFTVTIVDKVSPVAETESVVVTEENPNAVATVPVKVPPSICNLPAESMLEVPPKA